MSLFHKAIFVASAIMGLIWTALFVRIAFPRRWQRKTLLGGCRHRWQHLEAYQDGRAKARCLVCGKVSIVPVTRPTTRA